MGFSGIQKNDALAQKVSVVTTDKSVFGFIIYLNAGGCLPRHNQMGSPHSQMVYEPSFKTETHTSLTDLKLDWSVRKKQYSCFSRRFGTEHPCSGG
jgi:hypothetical protein